MSSAWDGAWGLAWDDAWGEVTNDPNAMRGATVISISAFGTLTSTSIIEEQNTFGLGWGTQRKRKIQQDDEMIIQIILQAAPFVI